MDLSWAQLDRKNPPFGAYGGLRGYGSVAAAVVDLRTV